MTAKKMAALSLLLGSLFTALLLATSGTGDAPTAVMTDAEALLFAEDDAELFGEPLDNAAPESAEEHLLAIRQGADGMSEALIATGGSARYYARGERLPGSFAELTQILDNAVLLKKGAVYQLLCCAAEIAPLNSPPSPALAVLDLRAQPEATLTARRYHSRLFQNPVSLIGTVQIESRDSDGNRHYHVFPGTDPQAFSDFGLQAGDRVIGVNGIDLADKKAISKLFGALAAASHIAVTLQRGGSELVVLLALDSAPEDLAKGTLL
ncbi:MAG: hypothetical protein CMN85_08705 [Spongiibacteraceae bacterium]|nr:hypothetical protein [Spongiibacteraceae bacterium]